MTLNCISCSDTGWWVLVVPKLRFVLPCVVYLNIDWMTVFLKSSQKFCVIECFCLIFKYFVFTISPTLED